MTKPAYELRALAQRNLHEAKSSPPQRAAQKQQSARALLQQARQRELFEHSLVVGRANVTLATFREYLRTRRDPGPSR